MRTKRNLATRGGRTTLWILVVLTSGVALSVPALAQGQPSAAPPGGTMAAPAAPSDATFAPVAEPAAPVAVSPPPLPAAVASAPAPVLDPNEPLAGFNAGTAFLRAPDNSFVLLPNGRLQVDGYFFKTDNSGVPRNTFLLRRARLELAGWVGPAVYFSIGADFAAGAPATTLPVSQSNLNTTDDFVAVAPWGDLAILQFGQYDAPFTLENRTSDKYIDYMERSVTVRAFGIPSNKEQGFMLHGTNPARNFYYSVAVLNGDGQNYKNVDGKFDVMGRAWLAPLSFAGPGMLHDITIGGSGWTGDRAGGLPLAAQTTEAGFTILPNSLSLAAPGASVPELHQQGRLNAWAVELNAPIAHRAGVRFELVHKDQPLSAVDIVMPKANPLPIISALNLKGYSLYAEAWYWAIGDDTIIGEPGMQMPTRLKKFAVKPPQRGLMFLARVEYLDEKLTQETMPAVVTGGGIGETKFTALTLGANYWISKRFRTTFNYGLNHFAGDTSYVTKLTSKNEQEFLFRLAIAL